MAPSWRVPRQDSAPDATAVASGGCPDVAAAGKAAAAGRPAAADGPAIWRGGRSP